MGPFSLGAISSLINKPNVTTRSFDFSNNTINYLDKYALQPDPLSNLLTTSSKGQFDILKINNNLFNCTCVNTEWFEFLVAKDGYSYAPVNYNLASPKNQNKCVNIPNCTLSQVLLNYHELCSENYECSTVNRYNEQNFFRFKHDIMNALKDLGEINGKILKVLTSEGESAKLVETKHLDTDEAIFKINFLVSCFYIFPIFLNSSLYGFVWF